MRFKIYGAFLIFVLASAVFAQTRTLTVVSEPQATVWIDDVSYGKTDSRGRLTFKTFATGTHKIRVRAKGFKEVTQNLLPAQKGQLKIALVKTTDEAELAFQEAETQASLDREKAVALYEKAARLRPKYAEAFLEIARLKLEMDDLEGALEAIQNARRARPGLAIASAVEGRIYKAESNEEKAIASFKRAIAEGKGFQPEAHTGLGLLYKEKAESFRASGDVDSEKEYYELAAAELRKAVTQLVGAPDALTIYQLLGDCYERAKMYTEAIKVYREVLELFPDANEATMFRSFIVQIEKRMKEEQ